MAPANTFVRRYTPPPSIRSSLRFPLSARLSFSPTLQPSLPFPIIRSLLSSHPSFHFLRLLSPFPFIPPLLSLRLTFPRYLFTSLPFLSPLLPSLHPSSNSALPCSVHPIFPSSVRLSVPPLSLLRSVVRPAVPSFLVLSLSFPLPLSPSIDPTPSLRGQIHLVLREMHSDVLEGWTHVCSVGHRCGLADGPSFSGRHLFLLPSTGDCQDHLSPPHADVPLDAPTRVLRRPGRGGVRDGRLPSEGIDRGIDGIVIDWWMDRWMSG